MSSSLQQIINNPELKEKLKIFLVLHINEYGSDECWKIYKKLSIEIKKLSLEERKVFQLEFSNYLIKLQWISFVHLKNEEILELISKNLLTLKNLSENPPSLTEKIRDFMVGVINYEERDEIKIKIREALWNNKEILEANASIKAIGDWLKDISAQAGRGLSDVLKENEYYSNNENFIRLSFVNQNFLKNIIKAYKYCWYSSESMEGLDEILTVADEDGNIKLIDLGVLLDIPALNDEDQNFLNESLVENYKNTIQSEDKYLLINQKYNDLLKFLQTKYKINDGLKQYSAESLDGLVNMLKNNLKNPVYLLALISLLAAKDDEEASHFKQAIMIDQSESDKNKVKFYLKKLLSDAGLTEEESAVYLVYLAKINKYFMGFAYFDAKTEKFKID